MDSPELYSATEIARAAGVTKPDAIRAIGRADALVPHADAVRLARMLRQAPVSPGADSPVRSTELFSIVRGSSSRRTGMPLAMSGTLHVGAIAFVALVTMFGRQPTATTLTADQPTEPMRLVFLVTPGPGGGGGGGGLRQKPQPPKARREGTHALSSPLPIRQPPPAIEPAPEKPEPPPPPPKAEPLPPVVAPVAVVAADTHDRAGVLEETPVEKDSHGPGTGGGAGKGTGAGLGEGNGPGIGPGSGGGTGGGPYRPGSGIEPPRLLSEVKPDYTEEARRRGIEGEVEMEIVIRRDGTVGDVKILRGLPEGLNDRAIQAVRQWRFSPARRLGSPVDVIVQVAVEFRMR